MLTNQIKNIIMKCVNTKKLDDCIGIIAYGSYITGRNNSFSDLDVLILMKDYSTQDCGTMLVDGIRVEFFIQDIRRLYELAKKEINNNDPSHLTKFRTCEIVVDKTGETTDIIKYLKNLYDTKIKNECNDYIKFSIFSINNRIEDLASLQDSNSFYALYFDILERIRNVYAKLNGIIELPLSKIEKIYTDDNYARKYIGNDIHQKPDNRFIDLYLSCLKIDSKDKMLDNINLLSDFTFKGIDFDPNNFHLKYKKKSPFRI